MTRQDFILSKTRWERLVLLPGFVGLVVIVALPFLWIEFQKSHPDISMLTVIAGDMVCICAFVFVVWFVYVYSFRIEKRYPYKCPSCSKGFAATEKTVLKTGRCYYCDAKVIDDVA